MMRRKRILLVMLVLLLTVLVFTFSTHRNSIDFNAQVKPIFNKKCITCHGGVRRKANFSLLFRSEALAKAESGKYAIIPGDPDHSEMIRRLTLKDPEDRMPYKHPPLSEDEIGILRKWIKEGAHWGDHWAYVAVKSVEPPRPGRSLFGLSGDAAGWVKNDIDYFIYDKLEQEGLHPSAEADKATLLRRVSLDLTGMPAPDQIAEAYLKDNSREGYERLVDSLLSSPHFGEKWATMWMDLARYADTKGYEADLERNIWKYRDWLIHAFNEDKPYDQFITEQIAGDLLPNPTDAQYIATAFHRNTLTNDEGGTDNEEFRTAAVLDRVNTTWEALMGTTFACVQCHSHPYDPFTHDEYYKFMAFFNNSRDEDTYADYPLLRQYSSTDSAKLLSLVNWIRANSGAEKAKEALNFLKTWQPSINSLQCDEFSNAALVSSWYAGLRNHGSCRLNHVNLDNKNELIFRYRTVKAKGKWSIHLDDPAGPVLKAVVLDSTKYEWKIESLSFGKISGSHALYFTYNNPLLKDSLQTGVEFDWFYFTSPFGNRSMPGYDSADSHFWQLINAPVVTTPVMVECPSDFHRISNVFERGNWLQKGKAVEPDVPHALHPLDVKAPRNRLGLAMWLMDKKNPLTARTMVNRLWEQVFGTGLAETLEDLGTQGIPPTHRELLDYLSWKFMNDYQWSIKKLLREMVLSATYRQDSKIAPSMLEKDPANKFYARGSRVRLSAEQVRDQALAASALLSEKMYGPSVMPYQPNGIWLSPWNGQDWQNSAGEDQYRRALYTYWKRTAPYPSMMTFDGTARSFCTARRVRTNTPLQALTTLNDDVFIDASRHFAYRMQAMGGMDLKHQISKGYEWIMYRPLSAEKLTALGNLYGEALTQFKNDREKTCEIVGMMDEHNRPETAALIVVANAMLNLDEMITRN